MLRQTGLYYPYIHVRSDNWLKASALYWHKIHRLVPHDYPTRDSRTAAVLKAELDFLENQQPGLLAQKTAEFFLRYIHDHGDEMVKTLRMQPSKSALTNEYQRPRDGGLSTTGSIGYIYAEKLSVPLVEALRSAGLAFGASDQIGGYRRYSVDIGSASWIGMDSRLAAAYMTVLAGKAATWLNSSPITDVPLAHTAMVRQSPESVISTLLRTPEQKPRATADPVQRIALLAIQSVVPRNLGLISVEQIVSFRRKHEDELSAFQEGVLAASVDFESLEGDQIDSRILSERVREATATRLLKPTVELEKALRSFGLDTARGVLTFQAPALAAALATTVGVKVTSATGSATVGGLAAVATYVPAYLVGDSRRRQQLRKEAGASNYLLEIRRNLTPEGAIRRQLRSLR